MLFSCTRPAINSALAAFCVLNRRPPFSRRLQFRTISDAFALSLSQGANNEPIGDTKASSPASFSDKDWFSDGKEAARMLKLELGITSQEKEDDPSLESESEESEENKFLMNNALESGRAAARELLKNMNADDPGSDEVGDRSKDDNENKNIIMQTPVTRNYDELIMQSEKSNRKPPTSIDESQEDYFCMKSTKEHHVTICLVPPPSATEAWEQFTAVRRECKDPGFYRWPPHANMLYPFLELKWDKKSKQSYHVQLSKFRNEVAIHLAKAAEQCKPFDVTIDTFGTFGGKRRAVLWAYPKSKYTQACDEEDGDEPLVALQGLFEKQFPECTEQRKGGGFHPHMTVSHYPNIDIASEAKEEVQSKWEPLSFHVPEIYLLERKGNGGQFKILGTIPLGAGSEVKLHDPPLAFPGMPEAQEDWVTARRKSVKKRWKRGYTKKKRRGGYQTMRKPKRGGSDSLELSFRLD